MLLGLYQLTHKKVLLIRVTASEGLSERLEREVERWVLLWTRSSEGGGLDGLGHLVSILEEAGHQSILESLLSRKQRCLRPIDNSERKLILVMSWLVGEINATQPGGLQMRSTV